MISTLNAEAVFAVILFTLRLDGMRYSSAGESTCLTTDMGFLLTTRKILKEKCDPGSKQKVIEQDE